VPASWKEEEITIQAYAKKATRFQKMGPQGQLQPLGTVQLEWHDDDMPPTTVRIGYATYETQAYIPRPIMQCKQCLRYGHTTKTCQKETIICSHCGKPGHGVNTCPAKETAPKCINCQGQHQRTDKICPKDEETQAILKVRTKEGCTYAVAILKRKEGVKKQTKPGKTSAVNTPQANKHGGHVTPETRGQTLATRDTGHSRGSRRRRGNKRPRQMTQPRQQTTTNNN